MDMSTIREMRSELVSLRDKVNRMIDVLEEKYREPVVTAQPNIDIIEGLPFVKSIIKPCLGFIVSNLIISEKPVKRVEVKHDPATTAEFDPLSSNRNKQEVKPCQSYVRNLKSWILLLWLCY